MKNILRYGNKMVPLFIPVLFGISLLLIIQSQAFVQNASALSTAITIDFLITIPFVYFLIIRKRNIPKITVLSMFVLGIVVLSFALPEENQSLLTAIKVFAIPIVEVTVLSFVVYKTVKISRSYKEQKNSGDFYTAMKKAASEVLPQQVAAILVTEISVVYYGFIHWRKKKLKKDEFSYHKKSTTLSIIVGFLMVILIETFAVHFLLLKWSSVAAWILTILSAYTALQIFALARSISKRPITVDMKEKELILRFGFFSEWSVSLHNIREVELSNKDLPEDKSIVPFSPLGGLTEHNVILHFNNEEQFSGFYGLKKKASSLAIYVDDKQRFFETVENYILSV
ncbi:hypothetical protein RQM59_10430 [Flavobacteriaceae bacterium S356]|uniref:Beta-carotene 15,15'-monooxygenase n=1 Tax=Asprobacillus argus TaxID=3076534 RepID=A0ABU3LGD9_9FLAO|nr:hypothetical protein [Flavobacteriaceae bacterium S356]